MQLDFFKDFDSEDKKKERLIDLLIQDIKNVKYLYARINLSLDISPTEIAKCTDVVSQILQAMASICYHKSRYLGKYRYDEKSYFDKLIKPRDDLGADFPDSRGQLQELVESVSSRTLGFLNGNRQFYSDQRMMRDKIATNFKTLKYLLQ